MKGRHSIHIILATILLWSMYCTNYSANPALCQPVQKHGFDMRVVDACRKWVDHGGC